MGSVITAKPQESSSYLDIVDGQQRLTTLLILFCCYRDKYPNINIESIDSNPFAVDATVLNNSILLNGRSSRLRLVTHSSHQSDFDSIVIKGKTTQCKRPAKYLVANDEEPKYKFINTSAIFCEWLDTIDEQTAGDLLNYIFNKVKIIRIDCSTVNFAIKLFQVLNDRGLDLTNSDLVKSFLLEKIYKKYQFDETTQKIKADQFIADWRETENTIKDSHVSMNDLFVIYEYYLLGSNPKQALYDELQKIFQPLDSNEVIADFKKFANIHKKSLVDKEDKLIYSFWYLRWSVYWKAILMSALHTDYSDFIGLAKLLRRYYYLNWIAGFTMTKIKQISFNLIKWIKDREPLSFIEKQLEDKLSNDNVVKRAKEQLNLDIYYQPWCKPLLCLIEYNQTDESINTRINVADRELHVEHILPRAFENISEWNHFKGSENVPEFINAGCNLTLLSGKKNIEASNNPFSIKMSVYKGKGKYDDTDTKVTAFRITQKILEDYESNRYDKKWNWQSMNDRWEWFCDEVEQILEIDMNELRNQIDVVEFSKISVISTTTEL